MFLPKRDQYYSFAQSKPLKLSNSSKLIFDLFSSEVDGKLLKQGLDIDDPVSKEIILDSGRHMGIGIYNIFQALNPPLIVLGGGLLS